jgi:hypothetical protein
MRLRQRHQPRPRSTRKHDKKGARYSSPSGNSGQAAASDSNLRDSEKLTAINGEHQRHQDGVERGEPRFVSGSQRQASRPSTARCQWQTSWRWKVGARSSAKPRTTSRAPGVVVSGRAARRSRIAVFIAAPPSSDRLHRPGRRRSGERLERARLRDLLKLPGNEPGQDRHRAATMILGRGVARSRVHRIRDDWLHKDAGPIRIEL